MKSKHQEKSRDVGMNGRLGMKAHESIFLQNPEIFFYQLSLKKEKRVVTFVYENH